MDGMSDSMLIPSQWITVQKTGDQKLSDIEGLREGSPTFPLTIPQPVSVVNITIRLSEVGDVRIRRVRLNTLRNGLAVDIRVKNSTMDAFKLINVSIRLPCLNLRRIVSSNFIVVVC